MVVKMVVRPIANLSEGPAALRWTWLGYGLDLWGIPLVARQGLSIDATPLREVVGRASSSQFGSGQAVPRLGPGGRRSQAVRPHRGDREGNWLPVVARGVRRTPRRWGRCDQGAAAVGLLLTARARMGTGASRCWPRPTTPSVRRSGGRGQVLGRLRCWVQPCGGVTGRRCESFDGIPLVAGSLRRLP